MADYGYLKKWLSSREIKKIREGGNSKGIVLSRAQVYNIMKGKSKNFEFRNILIEKARYNELLNTK